MAYPAVSARSKDWGTEILTDTDLESELDLLHDYINAALNSSTGHKHDGTTSEGPKILTANINDSAGAQGDVFFSSGTAISRLAAGTDGQFLKTQGAAADPVWADGTSFASAAEVKTGTESAKAVAPDTMVAHEGVVKGWINFDGSAVTTDLTGVNDHFNVASVTDNGTGDYTIAWDTDFGNANYCVVGTVGQAGSVSTARILTLSETSPLAAGTSRVCSGAGSSDSHLDMELICVMAIGDR